MGLPQVELTKICVNNKSTTTLSKNYDQSKHIDTRYHFIRECIEKTKYKQSMPYHMIELLTSLPSYSLLTKLQKHIQLTTSPGYLSLTLGIDLDHKI